MLQKFHVFSNPNWMCEHMSICVLIAPFLQCLACSCIFIFSHFSHMSKKHVHNVCTHQLYCVSKFLQSFGTFEAYIFLAVFVFNGFFQANGLGVAEHRSGRDCEAEQKRVSWRNLRWHLTPFLTVFEFSITFSHNTSQYIIVRSCMIVHFRDTSAS